MRLLPIALLLLLTACGDGTDPFQTPEPGFGPPDAGMDAPPDSPDVPEGQDADPPEDTTDMPDTDRPDPPVDGVYEAIGERFEVTTEAREGGLRRYSMSTTAQLRDNLPPEGRTTVDEQPGQMTLRAGNSVLDALFAMAVEEARLNSVESISDGAFNNGQGVPCQCFETGEKWNYVWTRDTAYAVELGLALIDPARARNALDFKLSERKGGGVLQIVQDTGSGGSWPVSSDRVVWALGAAEVLNFLDGPERDAFRDRAFEAMANTITQDRAVVFDAADGLYRGEQSFLDWREQTYPTWTAQDTVLIAESKSLSTNLGHLALLDTAARLADEKGDGRATQYRDWAGELRAAIRDEFWLEEAGMLSGIKLGGLDTAVLHKFDLLGLSQSVLQGVATDEEAARMVAAWPHSRVGPPVIWPQQPLVPIYHNRGIWPFVTAYAVLAARKTGNAAVFDHDLESLIRGAALNLSNMENFEFLSQKPFVDDGDFSGPVVNSRRQLWSVAGYLGAFVKGVFGMEVGPDGLRFRPFVTPTFRNTHLANTDEIHLNGLAWRGASIDLTIALPPASNATSGGAFTVDGVTLNGQPVEGFLTRAQLGDTNQIRVQLNASTGDGGAVTVVEDDGNFRRLFAPREPSITALNQDNGQIQLSFDADGEQDVVFSVYRDGREVAEGLTDTSWTDATPVRGDAAVCYSVESVFPDTGHRSHHSRPECWWGSDSARAVQHSLYSFRREGGGAWTQTAGLDHFIDWGDPDDTLEIPVFRPDFSGTHAVQLIYGNGAGGLTTGITAAVKHVAFEDALTGELLASGTAIMPHLGTWERWGESSMVRAELSSDRVVRVRISDGLNMSYFAHFEPYTGGLGGGSEPFNRVNITAARFLALDGPQRPAPGGTAIDLDGVGDLDAFAAGQKTAPGIQVEPWETFAMAWDDDHLFISIAAVAFEDPYKPFHLYLEASQAPFGAASGSAGLEYSGLTAALPFQATHMITARQLSDDGSDSGPWNGVFRKEGGQWRRLNRLEPNVGWWINADNHIISLKIPRASLGNPTQLRLAAHVVNAVPGGEWKDVIPPNHTPWTASSSGFYEINLNGAVEVGQWVAR